jgi:glycosyltransferase involved in cell wall biosynthesis
MSKAHDQTWIVYLSTYPPRECGIATFAQDLTQSIDATFNPRIKTKIIALNTSKSDSYIYPSKVIYQIDQTDKKTYVKAAEKINSLPQVKCVNIQHEYGIHGGKWGSNLIKFLETLNKPVVMTMHTVSPSPDPYMYKVTLKIISLVDKIIVLTEQAKEVLINRYQIDHEKINVIPHGIHPVLFTYPKKIKRKIGLNNKLVLSTFGLLSRGKGIEYVIKSLPEVVKRYPNVLYLVIGQTHPVVRRREGESYRRELLKLVKELKLTDNVKFYDRYLSLNEIIKFLQATDIYISTSLDPNQTVSGTLSYALGTGRCIVSTSFPQAKEIINEHNGILVNFKDPQGYSNAILKLLNNSSRLEDMYLYAYTSTRNMLWSNIAISYLNVFNKAAPQISIEDKNLPLIKLEHLRRMTDSFGLFQFAKYTHPDPKYGYTIDDNARALIVAASLYQQNQTHPALNLTQTYLNFIQQCQKNFRFLNYVNYQQELLNDENHKVDLADSNGRAVWALAYLISLSKIPKSIKKQAGFILSKWVEHYQSDTSARYNAFVIKGLVCLQPRHKFSNYKKIVEESADFLCKIYQQNSDENWKWFEDSLTYANGILPESLFLAYRLIRKDIYKEIAEESLNFLIKNSFQGPIYVPIGQNNWYKKGSERNLYDQQPEDITAMVQALKAAFKITKKRIYKELMFKTFYWFLGNNLLGVQIYDKKTGGSFDALTPNGVNLHQGAESTVSYLLARLTVGEK